MRHRFLLVFLILSLYACTFQVEMLTPTTDVLTPTPVSTETFTLTPFIVDTPTLIFPTSEVPATLVSNPSYRIQFETGGTWMDLADILYPGESKTYIVSAMKEQVMSVSILSWGYFSIEIKGNDGTVLCPVDMNTECQFWRGKLPSSQDYFITTTALTDQRNFTIHVAINPPGAATQSFKYVSKNGNMSFFYTDDFAPVRFPGAPIHKIDPEFALQYIDTKAYASTNLLEAYFLLGATTQNDILQSCTHPASLGGPENIAGNVDINGISFTRSEASGVATGNLYEQIYYRAVMGDTCYEVTFFIHSANIGVYAPDAGVKEFDRAALLQRFEETLSMLIIQ